MPAWLSYLLIRLGLFLGALALIWLAIGSGMDDWWWLAVPCAAIIALCIAYIAFPRLRAKVAAELAAKARQDPDAEVEDVD